MKFYSKKIINLKSADIHLHYANNRGRGDDNVTITVTQPGQERPPYTAKYCGNFIEQFRVSGWQGNVNVPTNIIKKYGGLI